jgi:hypothetical protein|nr:MAG TPA: hypothetical protein [Caudoviricetes sp.]
MIKVSNGESMVVGTGDVILNKLIFLEIKIFEKIRKLTGEKEMLEAMSIVNDTVAEELGI